MTPAQAIDRMVQQATAKKPDLDVPSFKLGVIEIIEALETLKDDGTPVHIVAACIDCIYTGASQ